MSRPHYLATIKNWKLFLLLFLIPWLASYGLDLSSTGIGIDSVIFEILGMTINLSCLVFLIWFWVVALELKKHLPEEIYFNHKFFRSAMLVLGLILPAYGIIEALAPQMILENNSTKYLFNIFGFYVNTHDSLTFICYTYVCHYLSRALATAEKQKNSTLIEHLGTFILLFILPIGIWFIQPRINKLTTGT